MEMISIQYPPPPDGSLSEAGISLAIGHFDGVHKGHRNVILRAVEAAKEKGLAASVMTFHPHPKEVLGRGERYFTCLTPLELKREQFAALGVERLYVMKFDLTFAAVTPEAFVREVLVPLNVKHAVVGFDFRFGTRGAGTAEELRRLGGDRFDTDIMEALRLHGRKVSSTRVRDALAEGDARLAAELLGRPYEVRGTVVHGDKRGRTIGFPTANLGMTDPYVTPRLGVYAVTVEIEGTAYPAVLNNGMKPTFNKDGFQPVMEAHLLDFNGDLYGKKMAIRFHEFIRPERRFASVDELAAQIAADAAAARDIMARDAAGAADARIR
ncbi:riboflavin biosynthesis protein RibF [Paenibacillus sp. 32O-W]|nr:riboflavin biosynthesis protein RibF [Paenibacillus sp. 32O-W]